ncbi:hypothetical protein PRIPAC_74616 [Pristionchus pacificus]|uniref:Uncharacterized protein n=1 Tax=Pristionchus pacificus TaxID=54126 RepID=A0A2A6B4W2_PRIPA|nr:hypothetical protein PRIPAC_74616 [Pristionchus pacificus]|eukprot:PDM60898.1 hypothetical protein PRIPAC_54704 [Pristionchus pacificus]
MQITPFLREYSSISSFVPSFAPSFLLPGGSLSIMPMFTRPPKKAKKDRARFEPESNPARRFPKQMKMVVVPSVESNPARRFPKQMKMVVVPSVEDNPADPAW